MTPHTTTSSTGAQNEKKDYREYTPAKASTSGFPRLLHPLIDTGDTIQGPARPVHYRFTPALNNGSVL